MAGTDDEEMAAPGAGARDGEAAARPLSVPGAAAGESSATLDHRQEQRIRSSFAGEGLMRTLGATLEHLAPGLARIALEPGPHLSQQHGFVHAGAVSAIADTAAGIAALSLMPIGAGVLTTEFKINLLAPATGDRIVATGKVVKAGRTLTFAQSEVIAESAGSAKLVAFLTATLMRIEGRGESTD